MPALTRAEYTEESAEVEVLFANMEKLKALTKKIEVSLTRLESSGRSVQDAVNPIYSNTRKLQMTSVNIDRIYEAINKIREPLDRKRREETIIKGGLQQTSLVDYLASLDRANQALTELKNSNLRSNQQAISDLNGLLKLGGQQLEKVFRTILQEESKTLEPLHYVTKKKPFPTISSEKSSILRQINTNTGSGFSKTQNVYVEVRGPYLVSCLSSSVLATTNSTRKQKPDAIYLRGTSGIEQYTQAIEGLFVAESDSICPIFAREYWSRVLNETCMAALNDFSKTLSKLHHHIKEHMVTDCFLAYEVVEHVQTLSYRLETKARASDLKQPVQYALRPIKETAKYSLQRLLEDIQGRIQNITVLSPDASTHPLTFEVMTRLQIMTEYMAVLPGILVSVGDGGWRSRDGTPGSSVKSFDVGNDGRELFSNYAAEMIETLLMCLDNKAKVLLKNSSARGIFLANNVAVVERMVAGSDLAGLLNEVANTKTDTWRKKGTALCLDAWREPSIHLRDVQYTNRTSGQHPPTGTGPSMDSTAYVKALGSKEKDAIKEKFRNFNAIFDELVARHKSFKMEREVKLSMAREIQGMIEPLYARFWDRYHELDKGKGKYVKYDKNQLNTILGALG